jgi:hypothetical protein
MWTRDVLTYLRSGCPSHQSAADADEPVAWRARSSAPVTLPTYISKVTRVLLCPASRDTSLTSSFQVLSAVVQNTCRRLCRVHPVGPARHPAARKAVLRTRRLKLLDRQYLPVGAGNKMPSGLRPAARSCRTSATWMATI